MGDELVMYFNPSCSKCRGARDLLTEKGEDFSIVEYLKAPPRREALERIVELLAAGGTPAGDLVRKDDNFKALGLSASDYSGDTPGRDAVVDLLLSHPELMERPVLVRGDRAIIARPPERALAFLASGAD